jgi:peroxiredoxin
MSARGTPFVAGLAAMLLCAEACALGVGDAAPICTAPRLDTGAAMKLDDYRGQIVYLDFWASWCGPCRESFPFMNDLDREFHDRGLSVIAISVDKTAEDAQRFLSRYPARFALALDAAGTCPAAYELPGMPSSYLIDREGRVRAVHAGFRSSDKAEIRRQVLEALARP